MFLFKKFDESAKEPTRSTNGSAGYDLYAAVSGVVPPRSRALFDTKIGIAMPDHPEEGKVYAMRILPRSGLAVKHSVTTDAGLIDSDYRGSIKVLLVNHGDEAHSIEKWDRIAQAVIFTCEVAQLIEVDVLPETSRGAGGFGSTGV